MWIFKNKEVEFLKKENTRLYDKLKKAERDKRRSDIKFKKSEKACKELMSDGLRHRSSLAGKYMSDRNKHLKGK